MIANHDNSTSLILVVDDDPGIRRLLTRYLTEQGYQTAAVGDGKGMDQWLQDNQPDLIILDLMLPGEDGLSLTRKIRATGNTPIIMLTARGEEVDRIVGLEMGADDYLAKPFNPRELLARIRAVLRRGAAPAEASSSPADTLIRFGDFTLNIASMELLHRENKVALTTGEIELLVVLAQNPERVLSRDQLMDKLSGGVREPFDRSIDVRITRLRSKIEKKPSAPQFIHTVWGKGYRFSPNGSARE
ncbi:MAG: response regulator [Zetaproteobacteria bacterium]|jgi:DNA-binding response OmpR family regulator|nr:response regulator [Zetaproteobacteria bacterium]